MDVRGCVPAQVYGHEQLAGFGSQAGVCRPITHKAVAVVELGGRECVLEGIWRQTYQSVTRVPIGT